MQKSSVGFVYQINDLILVILRSSQTSYFFIIRKKKLYGGNRKGWRRVSENSIHPLLPSPKKRKDSNEKSFLKEPFRNDLYWISHFQSRKKKKKKKSKTKQSLSWHTSTIKFKFRENGEECCWVRLFSMLFRNYSSKKLKKIQETLKTLLLCPSVTCGWAIQAANYQKIHPIKRL